MISPIRSDNLRQLHIASWNLRPCYGTEAKSDLRLWATNAPPKVFWSALRYLLIGRRLRPSATTRNKNMT
jgi:hypothetical protein